MKALHWLALSVLVITPRANAQARSTGRVVTAVDRAAVVAALPRGAAFASGGEPYRVVGGVRAHRRAAHDSEAQTLARAGASAADVVERKGRAFVVVRSAAAAATTVPRSGHLVAVNARTGQLGVVTGILEVRLRPGADPAALVRAKGLSLVSSAPRLRIAFFRVPAGHDLESTAAAVGRDPLVESVEIEVLEHFAVPH